MAEVDTDDPEEAYAVVQNTGNQDWQHHPKIQWAAPPPQRAHTDVGDLLQCSDRWLAVAAIGTLPVRVLEPKGNYETTL